MPTIRVRYNILRGAYEELCAFDQEHVNSFALLYGVVANQRVGGGASAMT